jgi:hypothetical protein
MTMRLLKALAVSALALAAPMSLLRPARAQEEALPPGPGRATTFKVCNGCHGLNFLGIRRDAVTWETTINNMIGFGANISGDDYDITLDYLTTYFGLTPRPAPQPASP